MCAATPNDVHHILFLEVRGECLVNGLADIRTCIKQWRLIVSPQVALDHARDHGLEPFMLKSIA